MARTRDGYDAVRGAPAANHLCPPHLSRAVCNKSFGLNQFQIIYAGRPRLGASRMQPSRRRFRRMNPLLMTLLPLCYRTISFTVSLIRLILFIPRTKYLHETGWSCHFLRGEFQSVFFIRNFSFFLWKLGILYFSIFSLDLGILFFSKRNMIITISSLSVLLAVIIPNIHPSILIRDRPFISILYRRWPRERCRLVFEGRKRDL